MTYTQFKALIHSSSFQFSVTVMALIWSAVAAVLLLLYFLIRSSVWEDIDQALQREIDQFKVEMQSKPQGRLDEWMDELKKNNRLQNSFIQIVTPGHSVLLEGAGEGKIKMSEIQAQQDGSGFTLRGQVQVYEVNEQGSGEEGTIIGAKESILPDGNVMRFGRNFEYIHGVDRALRFALFIGLSVSFFLAVVGSAFITRKTLVRLSEVNKTCQNIRNGDLNQRVPVRTREDDFDILAMNMNSMLDQIQSLMAGIQNVSDNIAHDLKTPLSRLRSRLELMRYESGNHDDESLDEVIRDADRILSMFQGLLRIAKLESGSVQPVRRDINLCLLLADVVELYEPLAEEKDIKIQFVSCQADAIVKGDADLWFQVFNNIVDNAIKYTPSHGNVWVDVTDDGECKVVEITDSGIGIPENEHSRIFERFYRMEKHRTSPGHGLGMSLVKVVADHYRARIELVNANPGLAVRIHIPK